MEKELLTQTSILGGIMFSILIPAIIYLLKQKDKAIEEKFTQNKNFINEMEDEVKEELNNVKKKGNEIEHNYLKRFEEVNNKLNETQILIIKLSDKINGIPENVTNGIKLILLGNYPTKSEMKEQIDTQIKLNKTTGRPRKKEST